MGVHTGGLARGKHNDGDHGVTHAVWRPQELRRILGWLILSVRDSCVSVNDGEMMGGPLTLDHGTWEARYNSAARKLGDVEWLLSVRAAMDDAAPGHQRVAFLPGALMPTDTARIGVFTGSFNPLTWAHSAVAESARSTLQLDALVWASSRVTVDKERIERATLLDRIAQVLLLVAAEQHADHAAVLDAGLYVDQARALRAAFTPHAQLYLIVGYDKIVQILDRRYYADRDTSLAELFALCALSVAPRGEDDERALASLLAQPANGQYGGSIHFLPVPSAVARLSSTGARQRAADCRAPDGTALADISPPEGAALACVTGAYRMGAERNAYVWRQRWLDALARSGAALPQGVGLQALAELTAEPSPVGERARRWVDRADEGSGADVVEAAIRDMLA